MPAFRCAGSPPARSRTPECWNRCSRAARSASGARPPGRRDAPHWRSGAGRTGAAIAAAVVEVEFSEPERSVAGQLGDARLLERRVIIGVEVVDPDHGTASRSARSRATWNPMNPAAPVTQDRLAAIVLSPRPCRPFAHSLTFVAVAKPSFPPGTRLGGSAAGTSSLLRRPCDRCYGDQAGAAQACRTGAMQT